MKLRLNQGLTHAKQVLYHCTTTPALIFITTLIQQIFSEHVFYTSCYTIAVEKSTKFLSKEIVFKGNYFQRAYKAIISQIPKITPKGP